MRPIAAAICCLLVLSFGLRSEAAHVHRSSDHHEEAVGLHVDHVHAGIVVEHGHHDDHVHPGEGFSARHAGHHHGDVVYVGADVMRVVHSKLRPLPAAVFRAPLAEPPALTPAGFEERATEPRAPPRKSPPGLRAPPA